MTVFSDIVTGKSLTVATLKKKLSKPARQRVDEFVSSKSFRQEFMTDVDTEIAAALGFKDVDMFYKLLLD